MVDAVIDLLDLLGRGWWSSPRSGWEARGSRVGLPHCLSDERTAPGSLGSLQLQTRHSVEGYRR